MPGILFEYMTVRIRRLRRWYRQYGRRLVLAGAMWSAASLGCVELRGMIEATGLLPIQPQGRRGLPPRMRLPSILELAGQYEMAGVTV